MTSGIPIQTARNHHGSCIQADCGWRPKYNTQEFQSASELIDSAKTVDALTSGRDQKRWRSTAIDVFPLVCTTSVMLDLSSSHQHRPECRIGMSYNTPNECATKAMQMSAPVDVRMSANHCFAGLTFMESTGRKRQGDPPVVIAPAI